MKVLTLHQPYATLVALGAKTIETRSWPAPASLIGQRFAVHGGLTYRTLHLDTDDPTLWTSGSQTLIEPRAGNDETWAHGNPFHQVPLGCIVATAVLADCVPMVDPMDENDGKPRLLVGLDDSHDGVPDGWRAAVTVAWGEYANVTDQLPYGDFAPGRWAWLLADVEPVTEKCPARSCWQTANGYVRKDCPVCGGATRCDPIPFKGGQGLSREWTP